MQTWHKELNFDNTNSLTNALFAEDSVFFDIETTGFSPVNTSLYLIGLCQKKGKPHLYRSVFRRHTGRRTSDPICFFRIVKTIPDTDHF